MDLIHQILMMVIVVEEILQMPREIGEKDIMEQRIYVEMFLSPLLVYRVLLFPDLMEMEFWR